MSVASPPSGRASAAKTKVLLVDDHALVRAGIRSLLEKLPDIEVVGEAGNGHAALEFAREHTPHLVLMDLAMNEMHGLEATTRLLAENPELKVVILSMHTHEEYVVRALRAGAVGYIIKDSAAEELAKALTAVLRGQTYLSPSISTATMEQHLARPHASAALPRPLTPRQRDILQLLAQGQNTKEIAHTLGLSAKTVETHRTLLMNRLRIFDVPGLVRHAMRLGLIAGETGLH